MDSEKISEYIESLYEGKNDLARREFIEKTAWKDFVPAVEEDAARFLRVLLAVKRPKEILEIGTGIGYSAANMALAARAYGGRITTVESDETAAEQAHRNFVRAGVDGMVRILRGDALKILPSLPDESFDLVFQDADKRLYAKLLPDCIRVLKPGGVFLADDALFPVMDLDPKWNGLVQPMAGFDRQVAGSSALCSTLLPIGDGVIFAVKNNTKEDFGT